MLDTLVKIGKWQSQGKSEWDRFLDFPKVEIEDRHGNKITNYTLSIIFDLNENEVVISQGNLKEYDDKDVKSSKGVKLKSSGSKKISTALPSKKLNQLYITFFGKPEEDDEKGNLYEAIEKDFPEILDGQFKSLLQDIFLLKEHFREQIETTKENGDKEIDIKEINKTFELNKNEKIIYLICKVKSSKYGFDNPTSFSNISQYADFLERMYLPTEADNSKNQKIKKLCYASNGLNDDVEAFSLDERFSFNKMFVTTTQNYANQFSEKNFGKNYQASLKNQEYLDVGSKYLLNNGYVVRIANLEHLILPEFLSNSKIDLDLALEGINRKSELLFNRSLEKLDFFNKTIKDELKSDEPFWINFIAFDKGGKKYFKTTETIKDISKFHFENLLITLSEVSKRFENFSFIDWGEVMTTKIEEELVQTNFNFSTLYRIIPIKEKSGTNPILKNRALILFKSILENRRVEKEKLYHYFIELILCHYYRRYESYTNVDWYSEKNFYFAVRDSVFKYLAFFQLLKKLNLIDMEKPITTEENINQYDQLENDFFEKMNFNQPQRAMFYLGRMLNSVEYLQQGKNKTVIQKVNFNGMDKDSIQRLRIDLIEKAKQYNAMNKVIFTDQKFGKAFDYNNWELSPQEATFFILTGYSFGAGKKSENNTTD